MTAEAQSILMLQPPPEAAAAHTALRRALDAQNLAMAGGVDSECAGLAPTVQGIQRGFETRLRPALNQLAKAGLKAGTWLRVDNGGNADVAVSIVTGGKPASPHIMTYVRSGQVATVSGIRGGYQLYFKSGSDWNPKTRRFTKGCSFRKFDQQFGSNEVWEITLKPVIGGNASTSEVGGY